MMSFRFWGFCCSHNFIDRCVQGPKFEVDYLRLALGLEPAREVVDSLTVGELTLSFIACISLQIHIQPGDP